MRFWKLSSGDTLRDLPLDIIYTSAPKSQQNKTKILLSTSCSYIFWLRREEEERKGMSEMTKSLFLLSFLRSMKCMFPSCRPLQDGEACLGGFSRKKQWVSPHYSCKRHTFSSASSEFQKKTIKRDVLEGQESFLSIFRNGTQSSFPFAKRRPRFTRVTRGVFVVFFVFLLGKSNE